MKDSPKQSELYIVRDIFKRGGKLADDLKAKCQWEHMTPVAVMREWPSFAQRYHHISQEKLLT